MACCNQQTPRCGCRHNGFLIILVLFILLAVMFGFSGW